jgi:hypothetical protein
VLTLILAIAAFGLAMTVLTCAELRQPAGLKSKWSDAPIGLRAFVWVTVASIVVLLFVGVVT